MGRAAERPRRTRARGRGSAAVEFSLVFPVLMALLFGILDAGRLMISQCTLCYAVITGARTAAISSTSSFSSVQTAVVAAAPILGLSTSSIHYTLNGGAADSGFGGRTTGDVMQVYTTYSFKPAFLTVLGNRTLSASAQLVIQ